jgi:Ni/Co efflux regulator RcnB
MRFPRCYNEQLAARPQSIGGVHALASARILNIAGTILFGCLVAHDASAAPPAGKGKPDKGSANATGEPAADQLLRPDINYDAIRRIAVDQHYTGYKALPPGIAKNLARGKPLPPGIAKKAPRADFVRQLPQYPDYEWKRCGTDLVLVQVATQVVAEVLANIFQ